MTKEQFIKQIELMQSFNTKIDQFVKLGMDLIDTPLYEIPARMFDNFIELVCTEEGLNLVFWWLCKDDEVIYDNGEPVNIETIDQLYDYMNKNNLFV